MGTKELYTPDEVQAAQRRLREVLQRDRTIYTLVTEVSGTGATRWVRILVPMVGGISKAAEIVEVSTYVSVVFNQPTDQRGVTVKGAGIGAGNFAQYLGQRLSYVLYGTNDDIAHREL